MFRTLLPALAGVMVLAAAAIAQNPAPTGVDARCTTGSERACIDWERGVAIALGTGAPASWAQNAAQKNISAERAARLDAARNLLEMIKGVALTSDTTMNQAMVQNDAVQTSIQGELNSLRQVEKPHYFSDGSIQVKLETSLRKIIPVELYASGPPQEIGAGGAPVAGGSSVSTGSSYTGLVVDARGTGVTPAMSPKILDPEGREVYGSSFVSRDFVVSQGVMGYAKTMDAARQTDRVKGNPAVVKAIEAKGANKADLVISKEDAETLRSLKQSQTFLREGRVMVVLD
jgi:hypothetical protein